MNQIRRIVFWGGRKDSSDALSGVKITLANAALTGKLVAVGSTETCSIVAECVLAVVSRFAAIAGPEPHESVFGLGLSGIWFEFSAFRWHGG